MLTRDVSSLVGRGKRFVLVTGDVANATLTANPIEKFRLNGVITERVKNAQRAIQKMAAHSRFPHLSQPNQHPVCVSSRSEQQGIARVVQGFEGHTTHVRDHRTVLIAFRN